MIDSHNTPYTVYRLGNSGPVELQLLSHSNSTALAARILLLSPVLRQAWCPTQH